MTTTFPRSPRLLKGGLVLLDPVTALIERIVILQYNPDTLTRTFQIRGAGEQAGDRSEALRLTGPPVETLKVEAELDATDRLAEARAGARPADLSLHAQLAALESIVYPRSSQVRQQQTLAEQGMLEIAPAEAPLVVFVWSAQRVLPVRITELSITEEAFDPDLNPIRAKVSLGLRVLTAHDLGFGHQGTSLSAVHHTQKEILARVGAITSLGEAPLGISKVIA